MSNPEDLRVIIERLDVRTADTNDRVAHIEQAVFYGNGAPPLLARFARLDERTKNQSRVLAAMWGVLLGLLGVGSIK